MSGRWDDPLFLKTGWACATVEDLGKDASATCEMCEVQSIRFVHHMTHPIEGDLRVGCVCAGRMELDPAGARKRETEARSLSDRRARFVASPRWKTTERGNRSLSQDGLRFVVRSAGLSYRASMLHIGTDTWIGGRSSYGSPQEARGALFDAAYSNPSFKARIERLDAIVSARQTEARRDWRDGFRMSDGTFRPFD